MGVPSHKVISRESHLAWVAWMGRLGCLGCLCESHTELVHHSGADSVTVLRVHPVLGAKAVLKAVGKALKCKEVRLVSIAAR